MLKASEDGKAMVSLHNMDEEVRALVSLQILRDRLPYLQDWSFDDLVNFQEYTLRKYLMNPKNEKSLHSLAYSMTELAARWSSLKKAQA